MYKNMYTKQQISDYYKKSPKNIREILVSPEYYIFIENIAKKYNLNEKQKEVLEISVNYVLMKIYTKENVHNNLFNEGITEEILTNILGDIEITILNNLDNIHDTIEKNQEAENNIEKEIPVLNKDESNINLPKNKIKELETKKLELEKLKKIINDTKYFTTNKKIDKNTLTYKDIPTETERNAVIDNEKKGVIHNSLPTMTNPEKILLENEKEELLESPEKMESRDNKPIQKIGNYVEKNSVVIEKKEIEPINIPSGRYVRDGKPLNILQKETKKAFVPTYPIDSSLIKTDNIEENKLSNMVSIKKEDEHKKDLPDEEKEEKVTFYPGGRDPYREEI